MPWSTAWWSERNAPTASRSADPMTASVLQEAFNQGWLYRDRIGASQAGLHLLDYYARRHHHSGREVWRARLAAGQIQRNGCTVVEDAPLQAGDRLSWHRPAWLEPAVPAAWGVVHDDGDLLVIDKPSGLPVLPAGGFLEHTLLRLLERRHQQDPAGVPRPVHRLGRFTSGLLVCARLPATRARLSQQLRESTAAGPYYRSPNHRALPLTGDAPESSVSTDSDRPVRKLYRALLVPAVLALEPGQTIAIDHPIGRHPHPKLGWIWCATHNGTSGASNAAHDHCGDDQCGDDQCGDSSSDNAATNSSITNAQFGNAKLGHANFGGAALGDAGLGDAGLGDAGAGDVGVDDHGLGDDTCHGDSSGEAAAALPAHSRLTLLERHHKADLVQVAIASGRPHQIRIHAAAIGAPLLGDPLYQPGGQAAPDALPGQGGYQLQAWRLELPQADGSWLALQVPEPLTIAAAGLAPQEASSSVRSCDRLG